VVAYLLEHNHASRRTAERSGLQLRWRGPDAGNPDPDAVRLVHADREVPADLLAELTER
jgi:RimJ/RimL family protein N-acetyltransferase